MSDNHYRFHIQYKNKRSTVSVDTILAEMLAIKLGVDPDSNEFHSTVQKWLQDKIIASLGDSGAKVSVSYFVRRYLVEEIADKTLSRKWQSYKYEL